MDLDLIKVCPNCKSNIIDSYHCYICGHDPVPPLNKVPDVLLKQEPNDNLKGIFNMKYFLFHVNGHTMYSDGPFTDKEDAIKYVQDNLDIDIPTQDIILIKGERINLKRIVMEE